MAETGWTFHRGRGARGASAAGAPSWPRRQDPTTHQDGASRLIGRVGAGRIRELLIQRLSVDDAAPQKLRPCWDRRQRVRLLREESPELGMMPAERVAGAVSVSSDPGAQPSGLFDEPLAGHYFEILVHTASL